MSLFRTKPAASGPAFDAIFKEHVVAVWRVAVAMGVDRDAANDVVQETFMTAHRRWSTFDASQPVRPWLLGIARNVIRHHARSAGRRAHWLRLLPEPDPPESQHRDLERREAAAWVQRFVDRLDERQRVVFVLGHIEGLTAHEIAALLGLKVATVYARAAAAQAGFARFLDRHRRQLGGTP